MTNRVLIILLLPALLSMHCVAQLPAKKIFRTVDNTAIREISITDSSLQYAIRNYLDSMVLKDSLFKKYGYLVLSEKNAVNEEHCFHLNRCYYYYYLSEASQLPSMYTYINKRLVLIYTKDYRTIANNPGKRSVKKMIQRINNCLPPIEYFYIEDPVTHTKKKLQPSGPLVLEGGSVTVCTVN